MHTLQGSYKLASLASFMFICQYIEKKIIYKAIF